MRVENKKGLDQVFYVLRKKHMEIKNGLAPLRPILSVIGTLTYKLRTFYYQF